MLLNFRPALAFVCLFLSFSVIAQKNFQPGYVILQSKDTLRGQIDFREWDMTPVHITFLSDKDGRRAIFSAHELAGFYVAGEAYAGARVTIYPYSSNPVQVMDPDFSSKPFETNVFMRLLTAGKLNLYHYKDSLATDYFFAAYRNDSVFQLRMISRIVSADGRQGVMFDPNYKMQLREWFAECPEAEKLLARTEYTLNRLQKAVFMYNNCGKDTVLAEPVVNKDRGSLTISPLIGVYSSKVSYKNGLTSEQYHFPSYNSVTFGAGFMYALARNRQKIAFGIDALYRHFHSNGGFIHENNYINGNAILDYNMLVIDLIFRYTFLPADRKVRPFAMAGFTNALSTGNKSYTYHYNTLDNTVSKTDAFYDSYKSFQQALPIGLGVTMGRFSVEGRCEFNLGLSSVQSLGATTRTFYLLAGFAL